VITGRFTAQEANDLGVQLRGEFHQYSGNQKPHGWCHRRDSIQRSIYASIEVACF